MIKTAATWCPEIIFLGIGLPNISGYDVAKAIRSKPQHSGAFLVALTGYGTNEDRKASAAAGFDLHLDKPISLDDLQCVFQMYASVCNDQLHNHNENTNP